MNINHASLLAMVTSENESYFYTRLTFDDFSHIDVHVMLKDMQQLGVTQRINGHKKYISWIKMNEGLKWLEEKFTKSAC